jgi:hypothetical protein
MEDRNQSICPTALQPLGECISFKFSVCETFTKDFAAVLVFSHGDL